VGDGRRNSGKISPSVTPAVLVTGSCYPLKGLTTPVVLKVDAAISNAL